MKIFFNKLIVLIVSVLIASCTLPPKSLGDKAQSKTVNSHLICAKQIDIVPISINGAKPPEAAFRLSMQRLRKYTTDNVIIHESLELTMLKEKINSFIYHFKNYANDGGYLSSEQAQLVEQTFKGELRKNTTIVMIYAPNLGMSADSNSYSSSLRGRVLSSIYADQPMSVLAYNETVINNSPVISDTQAWKIVLIHVLGLNLGIPSSPSHNRAGHCTRRECNLYPAPDKMAILSVALLNGMPYDYCKLCQADLAKAKKSCSATR